MTIIAMIALLAAKVLFRLKNLESELSEVFPAK
jgi:hypothetical protein